MFKFFKKKKKEEVEVTNSYLARIFLYGGGHEDVIGDYECMRDFENDMNRLMNGLTFTGTKQNGDVVLFRVEDVKGVRITGEPLELEDDTDE